jgi:hypothetical protein
MSSKLVAEWRRYFARGVAVNLATKRLTDPPSRGCGELTKKGLSNFFESPIIIGRDGEI